VQNISKSGLIKSIGETGRCTSNKTELNLKLVHENNYPFFVLFPLPFASYAGIKLDISKV
jgi:hypothetical protein